MYSQEALDYKVATADVLGRAGIDVWDDRGRSRAARSQRRSRSSPPGSTSPTGWPGGEGDLRVPDPAGLWPIAADRWDRPRVRPARRRRRATTTAAATRPSSGPASPTRWQR